jgi:hypothetical protein
MEKLESTLLKGNSAAANVLLSDNSYHSSLRPFRMIADKVALVPIPMCLEPGVHEFS